MCRCVYVQEDKFVGDNVLRFVPFGVFPMAKSMTQACLFFTNLKFKKLLAFM